MAVEPQGAPAALAAFAPLAECVLETHTLPADGLVAPAPETAARAACELEQATQGDPLETEVALPRLIRLWTLAGQAEAAAYGRALSLSLLCHYGFYEDALVHIPHVRAHLDALVRRDAMATRWALISGLFSCLVAVGQAEAARELVASEALARCHTPKDLARAHYVMAMLHARYLPEKNLALAEQFLERGLAETCRPELAQAERDFLGVFLRNGLAFVRHRQGQPDAAIALCDEGFRHLDSTLPADRHRLHRSALLYNIAQVHTAAGADERALEGYSAALALDPHYSEYYNDRGSAYLRLGQLERARADFEAAIALSPPYPEVWTNLGQCHRKRADLESAVAAFTRALDLDPDTAVARAARAACADKLGRSAQALADYDGVLERDPSHLAARANRAALRHEAGDFAGALADLELALALAPDNPTLVRHHEQARAARDRATLPSGP